MLLCYWQSVPGESHGRQMSLFATLTVRQGGVVTSPRGQGAGCNPVCVVHPEGVGMCAGFTLRGWVCVRGSPWGGGYVCGFMGITTEAHDRHITWHRSLTSVVTHYWPQWLHITDLSGHRSLTSVVTDHWPQWSQITDLSGHRSLTSVVTDHWPQWSHITDLSGYTSLTAVVTDHWPQWSHITDLCGHRSLPRSMQRAPVILYNNYGHL